MIHDNSEMDFERRDTFEQIPKPLDHNAINYSKAEPIQVDSGYLDENDSNVVIMPNKTSINNNED